MEAQHMQYVQSINLVIINTYVLVYVFLYYLIILKCTLPLTNKQQQYTMLSQQQPHPFSASVLHQFLLNLLNLMLYSKHVKLASASLTCLCTVTCCTSLQPRSNRLYQIAQVCRRLDYLGVCSALCDVNTMLKLSNDAFLRRYPCRLMEHDCIKRCIHHFQVSFSPGIVGNVSFKN